MKIGIAVDHGGFELKETLATDFAARVTKLMISAHTS
jgi:ribose 5-phosphate isomerase RpiB